MALASHARLIAPASASCVPRPAAPDCWPPSVAVRRGGSLYCLTCTADQTLQVVDDISYCAGVGCTAKYGSARPRWDAVAGLCQALEPPTVTCLPGFVRGQLGFVYALYASSQACETPMWPSPRAVQPSSALLPKPPVTLGPPVPRQSTPDTAQPPARPQANPRPEPAAHSPLVVPNSQQPPQSPGPDCSGHGTANADGAGCNCSAGWLTNPAQGMTGVVFCNVPVGTLADPPGTKSYPVTPAATTGSNSPMAAPSPTDTSNLSDLADSSSQPFLSRGSLCFSPSSSAAAAAAADCVAAEASPVVQSPAGSLQHGTFKCPHMMSHG
eukprot:SM000315S11891  [mRNA]  locus=s315:91519:93383:+ [translate_table: standard]